MQNVSHSILNELNYLPTLKGRPEFNIGIIGTGRIALQRQIPAYQYAGLNVVAAADLKAEALQKAQDVYNIKRLYTDYTELLQQDDIDIVDICTNTFPRKQITLAALNAGKHVLSEKPFARSVTDAFELVETAKRNNVHLAIHQPTRWYYPCSVARELAVKGFLGEIFYVELRMHGDQDTAYYRDPVTRWHADLSDHVFVEWGAHHFDLVRWFCPGAMPTSVFAWGTAKGNEHFRSKMAVSASVRFGSGACASLSLNQATRFIDLPMTGMTFRIDGTEGTAVGDMLSGLSFASRLNGGIAASFDWSARLSRQEDPYDYLWNASTRDGHLWPMVELINAITAERESLCSGSDNIKTVMTYLAAMKSDAENRPVDPQEMMGE